MRYFSAILVVLLAGCGRKMAETSPVRGDIAETVFASGSLEPRDSYSLTAQTEGYLKSIRFDDGDTVRAGQLLAVIDNAQNEVSARSSERLYEIAGLNASASGPLLSQARQNIEQLSVKRRQDSLMALRFRNLYSQQSASKVQLENAELAFVTSKAAHVSAVEAYRSIEQQTRQQLVQQQSQRDIAAVSQKFNEITAPLGGKIYKRLKQAGDYLRRGEVIAVIGSPSSLYARLTVDENSISRVKPGQKVLVSLNTRPDTNYIAEVSQILPAFDERSQSFICEAEFRQPPPGDLMLAGTQLQANIVTGTKSNALLIPRKYLSYRNTVQLSGKGEQTVATGFISGEWVEVTGGLDESAVIVTEKTD